MQRLSPNCLVGEDWSQFAAHSVLILPGHFSRKQTVRIEKPLGAKGSVTVNQGKIMYEIWNYLFKLEECASTNPPSYVPAHLWPVV